MSASASYQQSKPTVVSPFDQLPNQAAGLFLKDFARPFSQGISGGHGQRTRQLGREAGRAMEGLIPKFQALGAETSGMARSAYGGYQASVDQFLQQLPGYQGALDSAYKGPGGVGAGDTAAQGYAEQAAKEAFSPTASSALYNQYANQAVGQARTAEAARGIMDTGAAGAAERRDILTPLAADFAARRPAAEQAAISGLTGATSTRMANAGNYAQLGAGLAGMAPQMKGQLAEAMPQLIQSLVTSLGLPMNAAGSIIQLLTGAHSPLLQMADVTKPTVAQKSWGTSGSASVSDDRVKVGIQSDVPGLEAIVQLEPVSFDYVQEVGGAATGLPAGHQLGLIAQAVQTILPEAVTTATLVADGRPVLTIEYNALTAVLVQAIKELTARVAVLEGA